MKTFLTSAFVAALVAVGVVTFAFKHTQAPAPAPQPVFGAASGTEHTNQENFYSGATFNKLGSFNIYNGTTTPASTTTAAAITAQTGFLTIAAGANSYSASTTAVNANSGIFLTQISTTSNSSLLSKLGSAICNTTAATSTPIVRMIASSTSAVLNGFTVNIATAPITNPNCYFWAAYGF